MDDFDLLSLFGGDDAAAREQGAALANAIRGRRALSMIGALGAPGAQRISGILAQDADMDQKALQSAAQQRAHAASQRALAGVTDALHRAQLEENSRHNKAGESLAERKLRWEMTPSVPDPTKLAKSATDLRKEVQANQVYKNMAGISEAYRKILSTSDTGAGDIGLIYGYMKLLDPGSTVREGEYATAASAGSVPDKVVGMYNRVISGEKLPPELRASFKREAGSVFRAQHAQYEATMAPYRRMAVQSGLDPADVVLDLGLAPLLGGDTRNPGRIQGATGVVTPPGTPSVPRRIRVDADGNIIGG